MDEHERQQLADQLQRMREPGGALADLFPQPEEPPAEPPAE